ncbi:hypothetical protein DB721_08885 [Helicobacter pylori]|uniref:Uncharacterized protein n=1 Tax=Helicobacter pylori TaxID=210 RepID=A0A7Z6SQ18_HELPX|nr:hypothetical protein DB721_08885 [Helicobacter pylori]
MLLDYDFLLLLNDESGKPTRYYYLLQDFEKDFVASEVAQNRARQFVKEIMMRVGSQPDTTICYKILKRILWLVKWLKIERSNSLRRSLGGRKSLKLKTLPLKFLTRKLLLLGAKRLEVMILKRRVKKSKADYPLGLSQPLNPLKTLFTEISIIMSKNY